MEKIIDLTTTQIQTPFPSEEDPQEPSVCTKCFGKGTLDDAGPGDIYYNTWECPSCEGTGLNFEKVNRG